MDMFPELFAAAQGMDSSQFATANMDQTGGATTQAAELFNPALTGRAQLAEGNAPLVTLTGFLAFVATAAADLKLFTTTNAAVVSGAASVAATWMDSRISGTPTATFKMGQVANPGSGLIATIPLVVGPTVWIPWNWDMPPGTGLVFTISGANRAVFQPIWIERTSTV